jgi:phosphate transport system permease protein
MAIDRMTSREIVEAGLARRRRKERAFRAAGMLATAVGVIFLGVFFATLVFQGSSAFMQTFMKLDVELSASVIAPDGELDLAYADFDGLVRSALREEFPGVTGRSERRELYRLVSIGAGYQLRDRVRADPSLVGSTISVWVPASSNVDMLVKGNIDPTIDESLRPISDAQVAWVESLRDAERIEKHFNKALFSNGDSREPELAGIKGALMGSFYMLVVTVVLAFPIGVAAAIYLEEFAPKSRWSDLGGSVDRVRTTRSRSVHQLDGVAAFGAAGRRACSFPVDLAGDHYRVASRDSVGAAVDQGSCAWTRRVEDAGRFPSRAASGATGHADRHHHRHEPRAG